VDRLVIPAVAALAVAGSVRGGRGAVARREALFAEVWRSASATLLRSHSDRQLRERM